MHKSRLIIVAILGLWLTPLSSHAQVGICATWETNAAIDAALEDCTRFIESGQGSKAELAVARAHRARIYLIKKDVAAANKDASEAIALDPNHGWGHFARASILLRRGIWDDAFWEVQAAIKLEPNNDVFYNYRGVLEHNFARAGAEGAPAVGSIVVADSARWIERAIGDFNQAISLNPTELRYHFNACAARALWGKELEAALAECGKAASTEADSSVLSSRCLVKFRLGKYAEAIEDCTAALKIDPKNEDALYVRGVALNKLGQSGTNDIAAAKKLNRRLDAAYITYGVTP